MVEGEVQVQVQGQGEGWRLKKKVSGRRNGVARAVSCQRRLALP